MICIVDYDDEMRRLQKLLKDVEEGRVVYQGTTRADLEEYFYEINRNQGGVEYRDLKHSCELAIDFYLGKIIENGGSLGLQLKYYESREKYHDLMDEMKTGTGSVSDLVEILLGLRK